MRRAGALLACVLLGVSCGGTSTSTGSQSPSPSASPSVSTAPSASPSSGPLTGSYGLLLSAGTLNLISTNGSVAASVPIATPTLQYCSSAQDGAVEAPPVSASNDNVYFRDGDTNIKMVVPPSSATNVTTVPGGPTTISFFSVSPDDVRIAVLVEDVSAANTISERLYVEDLHGGGNHADIYTTTVPKGKTATTLWPMGWHQGALVLALMPACTFEPAGVSPLAWHVANAATAARLATIASSNCTLSDLPSSAGVACITPTGSATLYDWTDHVLGAATPPSNASDYQQTALSPSGASVLFATGVGIGAPTPATGIVKLGAGPYATVSGHFACLWIDESHLLAPDAVIQFPAQTSGNVQVTATVTALAASGECAGRFPGGL